MTYINNQLTKDHYVYVLRDCNLVVKYVGEGRRDRFKVKTGRSITYLEILRSGGSIEIICKNLTKVESQKMEEYFIYKYKDSVINFQRQSTVKTVEFEKMNDVFIVDSTSPSGLSWKKKIRNVRSTRAGTVVKRGYYSVLYKGSFYKVHRIVWSLHNRKDLDVNLVVHHVDGNTSNNLPCNLQAVSQLENSNRKINIDKPLDLRGISVHSKRGNPAARLMVTFYMNDKKFSKEFSLNKYSYDIALTLALNWKECKIKDIKICTT